MVLFYIFWYCVCLLWKMLFLMLYFLTLPSTSLMSYADRVQPFKRRKNGRRAGWHCSKVHPRQWRTVTGKIWLVNGKPWRRRRFSKHPAVVGASGSRPSVGQRGHKEIPGSCYGKTKRGSARRSVTPFQAWRPHQWQASRALIMLIMLQPSFKSFLNSYCPS